jgi:predicted metal-dependent phosphoesterase TrpH
MLIITCLPVSREEQHLATLGQQCDLSNSFNSMEKREGRKNERVRSPSIDAVVAAAAAAAGKEGIAGESRRKLRHTLSLH